MYIEVLGSVNMDIVTEVAALPRPGETVTATSLAQFPGGKGANQAVAAARLGAKTRFIGAVGDDEYGTRLRKYLIDNNVDIDALVAKTTKPTGQAFINVAKSGENAIVVVPGANHALRTDELPESNSSEPRVSLTQFEIPLAVIDAHWSRRRSNSEIRIVNAAPAVPEGRGLFDRAHFIIVNEVELASYARESLKSSNSKEMVHQARTLIKRDDQRVIVTIGAKGAIAVSTTDSFHVESRRAKVVDTTGAGDCFCGAFAAALGRGDSVRDALTLANAAAAIAVGRAGAGPSMPTLSELRAAVAG